MDTSGASNTVRKGEEWAMDVPIWRVPRRAVFFALATFIIVGAVFAWLASRRLTATVVNLDTATLRGVIIHVTGRSYEIGDLASGKPATVDIQPTSESHIEVEFLDPDGTTRRLIADCYFEPGYKGDVLIKLNRERVVQVVDSTTYPY